MKYINTCFILFSLVWITSCDIINPDEAIPAYLKIEPFQYIIGSDGIASENITDGYIYVNGELLGAFNLPKVIPVIASGDVEIIIDPGIRENGISSFPNIYPFYERYTTNTTLVPGDTATVSPVTMYDEARISILFKEEFNTEANTSLFDQDIINSDVDAKEGGRSALVELDKDDNPTTVISSNSLQEYPTLANVGFLEMDYKCDVPIFVGVIGFDVLGNQTFSEFTYGLNAREDWGKVYFNYTELFALLQQQNSVLYKIQISAGIPIENGEFTQENGEIRLDNIKLVVF